MNTHNIRTCLPRSFQRGFCLLALLGLGLTGPARPGTAMAAEPHGVLHADDLDLSVPCAQVRIKVDPNMKDGMALEETVGLTPVVQTAHDGAESHLRVFLHNCPKGGRMTLRLSGDTALTLHDSPQAHIIISGTLTTLESNLDDTTLQLDRVESLDMSISGTSQVRIRQLDRAAQISTSGAARLDVDTALLSALSAQLADNSQLSIAQGQIDSLTLTASQQGEASIMASINNAGITTNDAASVVLNKVTGTMQDGGTKHITHTTPPQAAATTAQTIQTVQDPTRPPQPDGQAQGLNNPALPAVPARTPGPPAVPQSATHVANQPLPAAAPLAPTLRQGTARQGSAASGSVSGQPSTGTPTTNGPATPAPSASAKALSSGKSPSGPVIPPANAGSANTGAAAQPQPSQPAHPATASPAQPPASLPSQAIPPTRLPQQGPPSR